MTKRSEIASLVLNKAPSTTRNFCPQGASMRSFWAMALVTSSKMGNSDLSSTSAGNLPIHSATPASAVEFDAIDNDSAEPMCTALAVSISARLFAKCFFGQSEFFSTSLKSTPNHGYLAMTSLVLSNSPNPSSTAFRPSPQTFLPWYFLYTTSAIPSASSSLAAVPSLALWNVSLMPLSLAASSTTYHSWTRVTVESAERTERIQHDTFVRSEELRPMRK
mmetsp:Transcript_21946/g.45809  ORF Transcript_21946/g.45809 Transcript_21946/m.45809 type:complete len:220 (+) Transcript_21946:1503-2162(+)